VEIVEVGKEKSPMLGIYQLEGERLTICYRESGLERPTKFDNEEQWLLILRRQKPADQMPR
jgi:hypothetical protein